MRWPIPLLAVCLLGLIASTAAADKRLHWGRYDVDLTVERGGELLVVETQELVFDQGSFTFGVRHLALQRLSAVDNVAVREEGGPEYRESARDEPHTFRTTRRGGNLDIRYQFPPSSAGSRTIVISYRVLGALRTYPDKGVDQLDWKAIPAGNPFRTESSVLSLHLPEGAAFARYGLQGWRGSSAFEPGQQHGRIVLEGPLPAGREVEVVAEWPTGLVTVERQGWQEKVDRAAASSGRSSRSSNPLATLGFAALALLIGLGGSVLVFLLWHERGRDPVVGLYAEELREPPSELPAGLAGTLIDEQAQLREIVATIMDLARRGHLAIEEMQDERFFGLVTTREFVFRSQRAAPPAREFEQIVLSELMGTHETRKLSELKNVFYQSIPKIQKALYREVVREGYFPESPSAIRTRWTWIAAGVLLLGTGGFAALALLLSTLSPAAFLLPFGWFIASLALCIAVTFMPRKTRAGAEAAARWQAFRRHLERAGRWPDQERGAERFERWLPYAVAFGLEKSWLAAFADAKAPAPAWWLPVGGSRHHVPAGGGPAGGGHGRGAGSAAPGGSSDAGGGGGSLSSASAGLGTSLAGMSAGLGALLSDASSALASSPQSSGSGGGFSGGGGSFGGGSGGGGSSFG